MDAKNPLLNNLSLPRFEEIEASHVEPAIDVIINKQEKRFADLEKAPKPSWAGLLEPLEEIDREIGATWGPISHLLGVKNSSDLRDAYSKVQSKLVGFSLRMSQSEPIYQCLKQIKKSGEWKNLSDAQKRIVDNQLKESKLSGVGLVGEKKERFNQLSQKLSELGTKFSNNLLDSIKSYTLTIENPEDVAGLPDSFLAMAHQSHCSKNSKEPSDYKKGPWLVTLDIPSYQPFMQYCSNRKLRESLYMAYIRKASEGDHDNSMILKEILSIRKEQAPILDYANFADLSLSRKMAGSVEAVEKLLFELRDKSIEHAKKEHQEMMRRLKVMRNQTMMNQKKMRKERTINQAKATKSIQTAPMCANTGNFSKISIELR